MDFQPQPGNRTEFEANADRAREQARTLAAEGIADQGRRDRRAESGSDVPGPVTAFLRRIRAAIGAIRWG